MRAAFDINVFLNTPRELGPASEGEGGSLSSRSSAEDMVPLDGVRGSFR